MFSFRCVLGEIIRVLLICLLLKKVLMCRWLLVVLLFLVMLNRILLFGMMLM